MPCDLGDDRRRSAASPSRSSSRTGRRAGRRRCHGRHRRCRRRSPRPAPPARQSSTAPDRTSALKSAIADGIRARVSARRRPAALGQRAVVLDDAFQRFPGQVEPVELGIAALQRGHDAQGLGVVVEAAMGRQACVERPLAGMAERRMAEIMRQRQRFGRSSSRPSARASARAICATSSVWVSRVR